MFPEGLFKLNEVGVLLQTHFFPLLGLLLGLLQFFLELLEFLLKFSNGLFDILVFVEMQLLFLLFFDVFDILQFLLQLIDSGVFEAYLIFKLVKPNSNLCLTYRLTR